MKDFNQKTLEENRPKISALKAIDFCLNQLYEDNTKNITDVIVDRLSFEELIGALLVARDEVERKAAKTIEVSL